MLLSTQVGEREYDLRGERLGLRSRLRHQAEVPVQPQAQRGYVFDAREE